MKTEKEKISPEREYARMKHKMMLRIAKEGHSFPHWDTCRTCEEDFDEVFEAGKAEAIKQLKQIIKESSYVLLFVYIAITSINLSNLNEVFVRAFNWTILIGTSLFIIILT